MQFVAFGTFNYLPLDVHTLVHRKSVSNVDCISAELSLHIHVY